jgi:hypothetical protein
VHNNFLSETNLPAGGKYAYLASMLTGPNAIHPDWLTPEERFSEIGEILSAGFMRRQARQQKSETGERATKCAIEVGKEWKQEPKG